MGRLAAWLLSIGDSIAIRIALLATMLNRGDRRRGGLSCILSGVGAGDGYSCLPIAYRNLKSKDRLPPRKRAWTDALRLAEKEGLPYPVDEAKPNAKHAPKPENRRLKLDPFAVAALRLLILTGARKRDSPAYYKAGRIVLYTHEALDAWALSKIGAPQKSTSDSAT